MKQEFNHLHLHTEYSALDGAIRIKEAVEKAKADGQTALAITDHGTMAGTYEFHMACQKAGINPVLGCEVYTSDLEGKLNANHMILLAKNNQGYQNISKLVSGSHENFYRKPHVRLSDLEAYSEGVIATSACMGGIIPRAILAGEYDKARDLAKFFQGIYGEDFYLEIQRHQLIEEDTLNLSIMNLAKELNIELIAAADSHYLNAEDAKVHEVLLCIATQKTMDDPTHFAFKGTGYHMTTSEEMSDLFADIPEAVANTVKVAAKCHVTLKRSIQMPTFPVPAPYTGVVEYFNHLCAEGFQTRFQGTDALTSPEYKERLDYEMKVISKMEYENYFLVVQDYINFARSQDIFVGPGRGSAAGSLVAYCLGISDLDPLKFGLLFERFLNPDRISMPDVDTDFEHVRRGEVVDYIREKYGAENVCGIVTYGTLAAKMVCKDVARALGHNVAMGESIARHINEEPHMTIAKALDDNANFRALASSNPEVARILEMAQKLEGLKRHASQHACGMIIAPNAVSDFIPTAILRKKGEAHSLVTQHNMVECEEEGLLKMDLLGLKNLTVMHDVMRGVVRDYGLKAIQEKIGSQGDSFRYHDIPLNDRATYKMLAKGLTGGVFQLESPGMTRTIIDLFSDIDSLTDAQIEEQCFERIIAAVALYRPGPMESIPAYTAGMRDQSKIHYDHESLKDILGATYGIIVYQEQVIQIVKSLAGFSGGQADDVRKAMGKKIAEKMEKAHKIFIHGNKEAYEAGTDKHYAPGCIANGIPEDVATIIWEKMDDFAKYAFNRSHAACYAWITYLTAYMACHWGSYYYAAMCSSFSENSKKLREYLSQANLRNIPILPPCINKSSVNFDVEDGKIRYSLQGIKAVKSLAPLIALSREGKEECKSVEEFYSRILSVEGKCTRASWESLAYSGALDSFGYNRKELVENFDLIASTGKAKAAQDALGQISLFEMLETPDVLEMVPYKDYTQRQKLEEEYEALGVYISGHPIDDSMAKLTLEETKYIQSVDAFVVDEEQAGKSVQIVGQVKKKSTLTTKKGETMCNFTLQGRFMELKCVVFPKQYQTLDHISENTVLVVNGTFSMDSSFGNQLIVESVVSGLEKRKQEVLLVTVDSRESQTQVLDVLKKSKPGNTPVWLTTPSTEKKYKTDYTVHKSVAFLDELSSWKYKSITA